MMRTMLRPRIMQTCLRSWNYHQKPPPFGLCQRQLNEQANKWRRKIKISDQIRVVTDRFRKSAVRTGKRLRSTQLPQMARVRIASITSRPVGVFHRSRAGLVRRARERRDRGFARLKKHALQTRRRMRKRLDSAKKSAVKKTEGYIASLRRQMSKFGLIGLGVYLTVGTLDWMMFYYLLKWGVDVNALIGMLGMKKTFPTGDGATFWTIVGAAYACHKAMLPVRLLLTVLLTRPLWRYLVRLGWIKRPPRPIPKVQTKT